MVTTTVDGRTTIWRDPGGVAVALGAGASASTGVELSPSRSTNPCDTPVSIGIGLDRAATVATAALPGLGCIGSTVNVTSFVLGSGGPPPA
jgi:hypothetical protein